MSANLKQMFENFRSSKKTRMLLALFFILIVVTTIRIRLLNVPLERDEGEFAYAAQLMLHGVSPYQHAYNTMLKLPGTCAMYALFMAVFGETTMAIHAGVIFVSLATAILVYFVARRICGEAGGVIAAGTFALFSINPGTLGLAAHATHFVILPALAGIYLLQNLDGKTSSARIFTAGLLLGLAVIMKQSGAAFGLFAAVWLTRCEFMAEDRRWRRWLIRLGWLALGGVLPFIFLCGILLFTGDFHNFWFWGVEYSRAHVSTLSFVAGLVSLTESIVEQFKQCPHLWSLAVVGFILLFYKKTLRSWQFFIVSLLFFSFLAVCPGWYFREHYFIQILPVASLLAAVAFDVAVDFFRRTNFPIPSATIPSVVFAVAWAGALIKESDIYFLLKPAQIARVIYGTNPFAEAVEISHYIDAHCAPNTRILVMGSEPEIYFYSRRQSVTPYICTYPLMERQSFAATMQTEMTRQIEQGNPEYVVFVNVRSSWYQSSRASNPSIFEWFQKYQQEHLQLVGLVEISPDKKTEYRWADEQGILAPASSDCWVAILKHRDVAEVAPAKSQ